MTPDELHNLASQLGEGWQFKLARLLPCNVRTVRYWLVGKRKISEMASERIRDVVRKHKPIAKP
jgi:hypothetical protein